jgi:two-component system chemotaxis response regulator CheY
MAMRAKTILAVDDSVTMREMLFEALTALGFDVVQAIDGLDALEKLKNTAPAVIITDINMPRMNGIALIDELRREGTHKRTPILVLTTESDPEWKTKARKAGATGWIMKPFDPSKVADAIRRVTA